MKRRDFLAVASGITVASVPHGAGFLLEGATPPNRRPNDNATRRPVLVRAGFTRRPDGTEEQTTAQQTVVRSFDSDGRLAAFVVPVGEHEPYGGAPLHLHHEQDEWLYILAGEFVAEVGGKRFRLRTGDSLLMPMRIPHRWSHTGQTHSGAIHLYTPAGLMDVWWDTSPGANASQSLDDRKAEFEKYGTTLLGVPLTKEEIDSTA
ncbi:MAG TPA: cupin domain-containing protein [Candidatus Acidoferrales bacterium]|nr:cupin domain-containing protein [Candidatus Acidoferrales bacterium]